MTLDDLIRRAEKIRTDLYKILKLSGITSRPHAILVTEMIGDKDEADRYLKDIEEINRHYKERNVMAVTDSVACVLVAPDTMRDMIKDLGLSRDRLQFAMSGLERALWVSRGTTPVIYLCREGMQFEVMTDDSVPSAEPAKQPEIPIGKVWMRGGTA